MNGTISILPSNYDVGFIIQKAGIFNHYGYEMKDDEIHFVYPIDAYEAVTSAIATYEVDYLEVLLPQKLAEIDIKRKEKVLNFSCMGMTIILDTTTVANLTAAIVGLDRNTGLDHINWQYGAGKFVTIPREMMYQLADAAFNHMQSCFDYAKVLTDAALASADINELALVNVTVGWPNDPVTTPEPEAPSEPEEPTEPEAPAEPEPEAPADPEPETPGEPEPEAPTEPEGEPDPETPVEP